jgi:hypothetical protein
MKLSYKTLIISILCLSEFGLIRAAHGDSISELQAEMAQLNADVEAWNTRCARQEHTGDTALYQSCMAESARLEERKASLTRRIEAATRDQH